MAFRRSTVRLRSAPLPVSGGGTIAPALAFPSTLAILVALLLALFGGTGCATQQYADPYEMEESIERPADEDTETVFDTAGRMFVVLLAVGAAIGAVAAPILILVL